MSQDADSDRARRPAASDGIAKLGRTAGADADLDAPRRTPESRGGSEGLEAGRRRADRFVVRGQAGRFRVVDIWTGETAVIAMTAQDALSEDDAAHTAGLLNRRAAGGDRSLPQ